jgi:hypothetical protein
MQQTLKKYQLYVKYPNVLPEELPGMPPDRDLEFIIDPIPEPHPLQGDPTEW